MTDVSIGFVPLLDAAPLIMAHEMGFAAEEGLHLDLRPATSWSLLRDMLTFGTVQAAHMLAPVPVATALGLGGSHTVPVSAAAVLSVNGTVIGVSNKIADALREKGFGFDFADAAAARKALLALPDTPLRIGVPFPFAMHYELVNYWLGAAGEDRLSLRTVPPSFMSDAIANDEIDAFCVGEPWGSMVVENGLGTLILPGCAIWSFAPEKVLAMRTDWGEQNPATRNALIRAVVRAADWLSHPGSLTVAGEILSQPTYLDRPAEVLDRGLTGQLTISARGERRKVPGFSIFHRGAACFPWRSQAAWIGRQMVKRTDVDPTWGQSVAEAVFRSDWFRDAMKESGMDVPGASSKIEGGIDADTPVSSAFGKVVLANNQFFDRRVFDPAMGE